MTEQTTRCEKSTDVRDLARRGELAAFAGAATGDRRRWLRAATYEIVQPVVFHQLTRKLELKRGHHGCAVSLSRLDDACLDRFHDDMDAVIDDVFRNARVPIHSLEGWVRARLTVATVNGYRRRRGERGALQRPRVPRWLSARLGHDPRLTSLAVDVLEFVGNDVATGVWPTGYWAERRAVADGDHEAAHRAVLRDLETVLAAMRAKPAWYEDYVERPLGRKPCPVVPLSRLAGESTGEVPLAARADTDSLVVELAGLAVDAIEARVARGENPRRVAVDVVAAVFGPGLGADELDRPPGAAPGVDELVAAGLADRAAVERVADTVLAVLGARS